MAKRFEIRNSTAEFLIFMAEGKEQGIQVLYKKETIWATQKAMATLFDCYADNIGLHLKNIYDAKELDKNATTEKISVVQQEGTREVRRNTLFYNLDAIISVGYRVNSRRATQFRQWCTYVLRQYAIRGYVIDKKRMENGSFIGVDYFEQLLEEIREIRLSERNFYQKLTDIYATAIDYNRDAPTTREFFKKVQNKMHYAVHGHTAAELIVDRADAEKEHMGLTTWAIVLKETDEAIGCIGYYTHETSNIPIGKNDCEVGYWVGKPYWNRGICTEALKLMLDYCIQVKHFENIWADHFTGNPASGKVMVKCGFSDTGMLNRCSQLVGGDKDMIKVFKYRKL